MMLLIDLYEKHCGLRSITKKNAIDKPWMTKGLRNAYKKKNYLYRCFLKLRSKEAEDTYKKYKNKLVWIIRRHKKEYYGDLLNKNRNNMKATWGIINSVIKNDKIKSVLPNYFVKNKYDIDDKTEIGSEFNDFFCKCWP